MPEKLPKFPQNCQNGAFYAENCGMVYCICTMPDLTPRKYAQLQLFPAEDDAVLYSRSATYQSLTEVGQRVVRSYLVCLSEQGTFPTQSRIAERAGLSRHAVSDQLGDKASPAWQAITELLASCREDLAARGSIAIPQIAWLILSQFVPGKGRLPRQTSTLTRVELDVLKTAAAMGGVRGLDGGPVLQVQAAASADGAAAGVAVSLEAGDESLAALVSKLRESQVGQGKPLVLVDSGQSVPGSDDDLPPGQ